MTDTKAVLRREVARLADGEALWVISRLTVGADPLVRVQIQLQGAPSVEYHVPSSFARQLGRALLRAYVQVSHAKV